MPARAHGPEDGDEGMRHRTIAAQAAALLGALLLAGGCAPTDLPTPAARQAAAVPVVDEAWLLLQGLMEWVVDPAAEVVFAAGGRNAPPDRRPAAAPAWQAVADAADRLVEQAALLAQPGLAAGRADWLGQAQAMRRSAALVQQAARARDAAAIDQASDALRASCQGCHLRHAPALVQRLGVAGTTPGRP
jgi:hypothetical protein